VLSGAGLLIAVIVVLERGRRRIQALRIAADLIGGNASTLHVQRRRLVIPDAYGTVFFDKWQKEKQYYTETRIRPALRGFGLDDCYLQLVAQIDSLIEQAAQRPIGTDESESPKFVSNPEVFDLRMEPRDYEMFCAIQLQKAGWRTRPTPVTGDQGADVIAERDGKGLVVQCKLYGQPVGNDAVQEVIAARGFYGAKVAVVASNQSYTKSARQLASVHGVYLLHHDELCAFNPDKRAPGILETLTSQQSGA
jgi:restriction system protein